MAILKNVNTTDIRSAIALGCQTMSSVFNADDSNVPFFMSLVWPEASLSFFEWHSESHVPGRHLNALLNAEDAAGILLDEAAVEKHARAAFLSYSGPIPLPLNRTAVGGSLVNFSSHNIREGFHALTALVKYRASERARRLAEDSISAIFKYWNPEREWDVQALKDAGLNVGPVNTFVSGLARAIGPLVKYYRATGYAPALELALVIKEKLIRDGAYPEDGRYAPDIQGRHVHSTTCVMSSLAQLADLTHDAALMARVKAFYEHGLKEVRDDLGWSIESSSPNANPDNGEINNTGDILETALILGHWGYPGGYQDAERILRCHLLPSQLRDVSFIQEPDNPNGEDGKRNMAQRHLGAFGFPAPYGHKPLGVERFGFNMDIVGGGVASLCEAYRDATRFDQVGHWVNLWFDHETSFIRVESPYTHGALSITLKRPAPLFVRLPAWVDPAQITLQNASTVEGRHGVGGRHVVEGRHVGLPLQTNGYLFFPSQPVNVPLVVDLPLTRQEITLEHRTRRIRVRLQGDQVTAMDNFGADLTFFDPISDEA